MALEFPLAYALTQRFTLGEPRNLALFGTVDDGGLGVFLRSDAGDDPTHHLWQVSLEDGTETRLVNAHELLSGSDAELPAAERSRRERLREGGAGITSYATDRTGSTIVFTLSGQLFIVTRTGNQAEVMRPDIAGPVFDPRLSPDGSLIGFARGADFVVIDRSGTVRLELVAGDQSRTEVGCGEHGQSWGTADFVAAEEMGRTRGFWWSPDSTKIAVCRNDVTPVRKWWIANLAAPSATPVTHHYPQAGTDNPVVELHIVDLGDGSVAESANSTITEVEWDRVAFPYLASVQWSAHGLTATVQARDQRTVEFLDVDPTTGSTTARGQDTNEVWVDLIPGTATLGPYGLVTCGERDGARRLLVDDHPVSPVDIHVDRVIASDDDGVLVVGNHLDAPTERHVYRWSSPGGPGSWEPLTNDAGVHSAVGPTTAPAIRSMTVAAAGAAWVLPGGHRLSSAAWTPSVAPKPHFMRTGPLRCSTAVLLPQHHDGAPLPVLLDPYGGPHGARVLASHNAHVASQWFADQGFAVVITDGRGTPGRGTDFERSVWGDLATGVLDDQIAGLHDAHERFGFLDLDRVAIRGWSFGGYLAALAVLRRPDVFHAAIAGAPVTEWRLYDTHYTERYLGDPRTHPDAYDACSLIEMAPELTRPLLLIHGLADDNVVAAHTLQLSSALLAAGRDHEVLPLSGVTHMTPQAEVAQNLLLHQLRFIRRHLVSPNKTAPSGTTSSETASLGTAPGR